MAYLATIQIVIDDQDPEHIEECLKEMLAAACTPVDPEGGDDHNWIVDSRIESIDALNDVVCDAITNQTYSEGDAFAQYVIYSRSEAAAGGNELDGYWSNVCGWGDFNLALRISPPVALNLPMSAGQDAVLVRVPSDGSAPFNLLREAEAEPMSADEMLAPWRQALAGARKEAGVLSFRFHSTAQNRSPENEALHTHDGQTCRVVRALTGEAGADRAQYDEEVLPMLKVQFDDGVTIEAFCEELTPQSEAAGQWLRLIESAFAVSRGESPLPSGEEYLSLMDLAENGTAADKHAFRNWALRMCEEG